jgi:hypothetical protein
MAGGIRESWVQIVAIKPNPVFQDMMQEESPAGPAERGQTIAGARLLIL